MQATADLFNPVKRCRIHVFLCQPVVYSSCAVKLISWNVNGLRAVLKKNFLEFLDAEQPDVLCLQETKCTPDQVEQLWPRHYTTYWNCAEKKGYSGTAIFTKERRSKSRRTSASPSTTTKAAC